MMVLYYTAFSYLAGNCDNHLKNISLLYGADWADREVPPLTTCSIPQSTAG